MKKIVAASVLMATWLSAGNLTVTQGSIQAHTEVFGDTSIDPKTDGLVSHLKIGNDPVTLKGSIDISMQKLKSDNNGRDTHMYETIESVKFPQATYTINHVEKSKNGYMVDGILDFHGVKKPLEIDANMIKNDQKIQFQGKSSFLMSDYGITPPKLLFLKVRDKIDLTINVDFKNS